MLGEHFTVGYLDKVRPKLDVSIISAASMICLKSCSAGERLCFAELWWYMMVIF